VKSRARAVHQRRRFSRLCGPCVALRERADKAAQRAGVPLTTDVIPGDPMTCGEPATDAFFENVRALAAARG
jgi:hypothetical protein